MGLFSDTVDGKVIYSEIREFNSMRKFVVGFPKQVTLLKIHDGNSNKEYQGFIFGPIRIPLDSHIICELSKTWDDWFVIVVAGTVELEQNSFASKSITFRKIGKYEIINR